MTIRISRAQKSSLFLGNLFEHYDGALYGLLSPFIAPLFFPSQDPLSALILAYAIIPLGILVKPLGAVLFGYIADKKGRAKSLYLSLLGMSITSFLIAFCPTYEQAGAFAPLFLAIARICQSLFASGETIGGAVYLLEGSPEKKRDLLSSLYNSSTLSGYLIASGSVALLATFGNIETGWRMLYLGGSITAFFGWMLRRNFPEIEQTATTKKEAFFNFCKTIWRWRKEAALIALVSGFAYSTYTVALVMMNGFIPLVTSITKAEMMQVNTFLIAFDFAILPLFGWLAYRLPRDKMILASAVCAAVTGIPLFIFLEGASLPLVIGIRMLLVVIGVAFFATFHSWSQRLVPAECRCSVISLGYSLGSQLLGSFTPALSLFLFQKTGLVASASWYWVLLALVCVIFVTRSVKQEAICVGGK